MKGKRYAIVFNRYFDDRGRLTAMVHHDLHVEFFPSRLARWMRYGELINQYQAVTGKRPKRRKSPFIFLTIRKKEWRRL